MDFHTLTRRDLQALCKKNKIPANMTNVAMADSLKALEIVEGIEEFLQACESETAQSSIESPVRSEITSPYVPPTGGRSTRRRNPAKEEPETTKPSARAPRSTRRTLGKIANVQLVDLTETPSVVPQSNRRKVQISSACRNMDFQSKECMDEENNGVSETPAPSGVTTRRRRGAKEESTAKRVYSTRRSARLAEKHGELLNEVAEDNLDDSKKELFTDDCLELKTNLKESLDDLDEVSEITGVVDSDITMEENSESKDEAEVVSAENKDNDVSTIVVVKPAPIVEISSDSEADDVKLESKESINEDVGFGSETEAEAEKEKYAETYATNEKNKAQDNNGSLDVQTCEIEVQVEKLEQNADEDAGCDLVDNFVDYVVPESEGSHVVQTSEARIEVDITNKQDADEGEGYEDQVAIYEKQKFDGNAGCEEVLSLDVQPSVIEIEGVDKITDKDNGGLEVEEQITAKDAVCEDEVIKCDENPDLEEDVLSLDVQPSAIEIEGVDKSNDKDNGGLEIEGQNTAEDEGCEDEVMKCDENPDLENEVGEASADIVEENVSINDDMYSEDVTESHVNKEVLENNADVHGDSSDELNFDISLMNDEEEASKWHDVFASANAMQESVDIKLAEHDVFKACTTPIRASASKALLSAKKNKPADTKLVEDDIIKASATPMRASASKALLSAKKNKPTVVSDNKENISSVVLAKEKVKKVTTITEDKLAEMSVRKLTKMLKEKLQIANDVNAEATPARPALQVLPENRKAD